MSYEIKTYTKESIATLKNSALKKSLNIMLNASNSGRSALWKYAYAIADIIRKESFVEDFETQTAFARYIDVSKSTITNYTKAVEFVEREDVKSFFQSDISNISVGKAYILSTLDEEDLHDFFNFVETEDMNIIDMSEKTLRAMLKELYTESEHAEDVEVESSETEISGTTDNDSSTDAITDVYTEPIITAELDGKNIVVTLRGATFCKERIIALDDELIECINAEFGDLQRGEPYVS